MQLQKQKIFTEYLPHGRYCSKWWHALFHLILPTANEIRKVTISILQVRKMKFGEFKLEGESELELRQFGARAGNPNLYILLPLLAVMAQANTAERLHTILPAACLQIYYYTYSST